MADAPSVPPPERLSQEEFHRRVEEATDRLEWERAPRSWHEWARKEFLWPGRIIGLAVAIGAFVYGNTHETWAGGVAYGVGLTALLRQLDITSDNWREWRRQVRRRIREEQKRG